MKIVKFGNNKYGIRRYIFLLGYSFRDLKHGYWWNRNSAWFRDCQGTLNDVKKEWNRLNDNGTIIRFAVLGDSA